MEVTINEVTTMTINRSSFEEMVRNLSGNAIKVFIAAVVLKLADWASILPPDDLNDALFELSINGCAFPQCEGEIIFPTAEIDCIPMDRFRELVQADKDGRIEVLPCKVGTTVYRIVSSICKWRDADHCDTYCSGDEYEDCWDGEREVVEEKFNLDMLDLIGKTVFLTRENAEAALVERE